MPIRFLAYVFSAAAFVGTLLQLTAVFGLPFGGLALTGPFSGQTDLQARGVAFAMAGALALFAGIVLQAARVIGTRRPPSWLLWGIVALTLTAAAAQLSDADILMRLQWIPLLLGMAVSAALIAVASDRA